MTETLRYVPVRRRLPAAAAAVVAAVAVVAGALFVLRDDGEGVAPPPPTTTTTASTVPPTEVPPSTDVATPVGDIPAYDAPGGTQISTFGHWYGYLMTSPILEERPGWVRVMLPERPNGLTGWVQSDLVTRGTSPWRMVVKLSETRMYVYKDGYEQWSAPVGIGKDSTRTPTGSYFVAVIEKPGPAGYGPIVVNLNAHSEDIQSWKGSGDAITAFHGPFGADAAIRAGGGKMSNGCIRMLTEDQLKMDGITLGTPVDIVA